MLGKATLFCVNNKDHNLSKRRELMESRVEGLKQCLAHGTDPLPNCTSLKAVRARLSETLESPPIHWSSKVLSSWPYNY